jgi:ParB-like chromosome segregation protein Spo0J
VDRKRRQRSLLPAPTSALRRGGARPDPRRSFCRHNRILYGGGSSLPHLQSECLDSEMTMLSEQIPSNPTAPYGPTQEESLVVTVPVSLLKDEALVRQCGVNRAHVQFLAQLEGRWSPILIARDSFQIIDGIHRLHAARLLGLAEIECAFFDGQPEAAYVEAIRRNAQHGLVLTLKDRKHAAAQLLRFGFPWSDRRIARLVGMSPTTVGSIRAEISCMNDPVGRIAARRIGVDGRQRPTDKAAAYQRISDAIRSDPHGSLRKLAARANTSPESVRKVRNRLFAEDRDGGPTCRPGELRVLPSLVQELAPEPSDSKWETDSALASTDSGKKFIEWFEGLRIDDEWHTYVSDLPRSRLYEISDEARRRARCWTEFAEAVENRVMGRH